MNRAQIGLWGAIASIFLLAVLGIRSAANWLAQGTPTDTAEPALTVTSQPANRSSANGRSTERDETQATGTRAEDRIIVDRDRERINAQTGEQSETPSDQPTAQQANTLTFSPMEEAGTYIQRQKSVERDSFVAATQVEAVPVERNQATATQSDSRVEQPTPTPVTDNQPSQPSPATSASPAVPALW